MALTSDQQAGVTSFPKLSCMPALNWPPRAGAESKEALGLTRMLNAALCLSFRWTTVSIVFTTCHSCIPTGNCLHLAHHCLSRQDLEQF